MCYDCLSAFFNGACPSGHRPPTATGHKVCIIDTSSSTSPPAGLQAVSTERPVRISKPLVLLRWAWESAPGGPHPPCHRSPCASDDVMCNAPPSPGQCYLQQEQAAPGGHCGHRGHGDRGTWPAVPKCPKQLWQQGYGRCKAMYLNACEYMMLRYLEPRNAGLLKHAAAHKSPVVVSCLQVALQTKSAVPTHKVTEPEVVLY